MTLPPGPNFSTWNILADQIGSIFRPSKADEGFDFLKAAMQWTKEYGDIVHWNFYPNQAFIVNHPDAIHEVLVTKADSFHKAPFYKQLLSRFLGNGILVSDGDFWRRQRKLAQPAFHHKRIEAYAQIMVDYTLKQLEQWHDGQTFDAADEMMRATLNIVAKTLFDADVSGEADSIRHALDELQSVSTEQSKSFVTMMIPEWVPIPLNLRQQRATKALDNVILRIIRERRASGEDKGDLLSMLLLAVDESGGGMTDAQARDEAITLFLAGYETTSNLLVWVWSLLGRYPEAEAKLYEELDRVLGERPPTFHDLPNLKYTDWIIKETLRLYPSAHGFGRQAIEDVEIGGYTVPKDSIVFMYPFIIHRDPRWFSDPETFKPERWANDFEKTIPKYSYIPFGGGPRVCIGDQFALMEARLVLATIAQRYRLVTLPGQTFTPEALITMRPKDGVKVRLEARHRVSAGDPLYTTSV